MKEKQLDLFDPRGCAEEAEEFVPGPVTEGQLRRLQAAFDSVKDSGERQEFSTGSVRDTRAGKGRYDLVTPIGLRRLAQHYENGAVKYGDRNWERGQPISRFIDSAIRHLYAHLEGDRSEDHLAAAAWNAVGAIHTEVRVAEGALPEELSDLEHVANLRLRLGEPRPIVRVSEKTRVGSRVPKDYDRVED